MPSRRRFMVHGLALVGVAGLAGCAGGLSGEAQGLSAADLRAGGLTLYLRHGATNRSGEDNPRMPREEQRLLSAQGEAQSRAIAEGVTRLRVPVGAVLASPMHRCIDTATLAFGRAEVEPMLLNAANRGRPLGRIDWLRRTLATPVTGGLNRVLVGHSPNLTRAAGITIAEGETAVFRADGAGGFVLLGRIPASDWADLA